MTKFYVNELGQYIGCSTDPVPPKNGIEVPTYPKNVIKERWNGTEFVEVISKEEALLTITVTTQSGKTFDGNEAARTDILSTLQTGEFLGITETNWKMADNSVQLVTRDELIEALALAIQAKGRIVGAIE